MLGSHDRFRQRRRLRHLLTPAGGDVFTISTNGTNVIGTVAITGPKHPNAALVTTGTGTGGSDSITWGAQAGVATFTFTYGLSNGGGDTDAARFSFKVVPEPSRALLLALGSIGLLLRHRR